MSPRRSGAVPLPPPGVAVSLDLETYSRRRASMLALLRVAGGLEPFGSWMKHSDSIAARRTEKLEAYLDSGLFYPRVSRGYSARGTGGDEERHRL